MPFEYFPIMAATLLGKYFSIKTFNSGTGTLSFKNVTILKNISIIATA